MLAKMRLVLGGVIATLVAAYHTAMAQSISAQEIWFYPLDNQYRAFLKTSVDPDYMQLFAGDTQWQQVLPHISVFVISAAVPLDMSPDEITKLTTFLRQHRIALALQTQGLEPKKDCSQNLEAYRPLSQFMTSLQRIKDAGGEVRYVSLDEPLWYAHSYTGKNACKSPISDVVMELASRLKSARTIFPDLRFGDVEPINVFSDADRATTFESWYKAYQAAAGEPFAYMQADIVWNRPWQPALMQLAQISRGAGVKLGVIYDGNNTTADDSEWISQARSRAEQVQAVFRPAQVVFESWMVHPSHVLPETDPTSFTGLIRSYLTAHP